MCVVYISTNHSHVRNKASTHRLQLWFHFLYQLGATKTPTIIDPVPATGISDDEVLRLSEWERCISFSRWFDNDSTAAMKTPPPRLTTLISGGTIIEPSNPTTPKLHLHHTSQMAVRQCYLFAWSAPRFHPPSTIITHSTSLFSSDKPNEQSNVVANTASTSSIAVHKSQHEWPPRITLSVTQWSPFINSLLSSDAIYSSDFSIIQLIMLMMVMMMVMARAMPMAMMMAKL